MARISQLRALAGVGAALLLGSCGGGRALPPIAQAPAFPHDQAEMGAALVKLGDCSGCHTASPDQPYAGGRPIATPFGAVYSANITPDRDTGIGGYSPEAFRRAMRLGLRRDGAHLYPAMPYDHFSYAGDGDIDAIYAFLMTRRPIHAVKPANRLIPPLGFRPVIGIWKALYFRPGRFAPDPGQSQDWNRGAYLAQSLGHCGGCHTPRNFLGAEKRDQALSGGEAEGWYAPPLNALSPAATPWTPQNTYDYLKTGLARDHAASAGPMGGVVHELARAPEADVRALALYLSTQLQPSPAGRGARTPPPDRAQAAAQAHPEGARLYAGTCVLCHDAGAPMMREGRPPLQLATVLHEDTPRDVIQVVLQGLKPPVGAAGPYMPPFRDSLTDAQVAEVAAYLRSRYSDRPPWPGLAAQVAKARKEAAP